MIGIVIDSILHVDQYLTVLSAQYGMWIYAILFLIIFCETGLVATPFLPDDFLLFIVGGIAAIGGMNIYIIVLIPLIAVILGDVVSFMIGKHSGAKLLSNPDSRIFRCAYLEKTHAFYEKHGNKTIIIARFVLIVRTLAPFVASIGGMHYDRFIRYNTIGALAWVLLFSYSDYSFVNIPLIKSSSGLALGATIVISILPAVTGIVRARYAAEK